MASTSRLTKGVATLLLGSTLARIISLLAIPVLSRIYSPQEFGVLAIYIAFVTFLSPIMTLRYAQAIPLPRTDALAFNLLVLSLGLIVVLGLVLAVLLFLLFEDFLKIFTADVHFSWYFLLLGVTGLSLYEVFSLWATRKKNFTVIALTQFSQSVVGNFVKIVLGVFGYGATGLVIGQLFNQGFGGVRLIKSMAKDFDRFICKVNLSKIKFSALYYQDFVWFKLPSQILMVVSLHAPVLISSVFYGDVVTGQLAFSMMVLLLPINLLGASVSRAYYAEISSIGKKDFKRIKRLTLQLQVKLFGAALPMFLILLFFSDVIFVIAFGSAWYDAGVYTSILSFFMLFKFLATPLEQLFSVVGKQKTLLILNVLKIIGFLFIYILVTSKSFESYDFIVVLGVFLSIYYLIFSLVVTWLVFFLDRSLSLKR